MRIVVIVKEDDFTDYINPSYVPTSKIYGFAKLEEDLEFENSLADLISWCEQCMILLKGVEHLALFIFSDEIYKGCLPQQLIALDYYMEDQIIRTRPYLYYPHVPKKELKDDKKN